jgi:ribosomal protein L11 methyltransferase
MAEPIGWRVVVDVPADEVELVSDRLFAHGALGIEERPAPYDRVQLLAGMSDEDGARHAAGELVDAIVQPIHDDGWADQWRAWAKPVRVRDVVVRPAWIDLDDEIDANTTIIAIDPGRSFGSGAHETTRLALEALIALDVAPSARVLDVGCGSGVLGIAVARLRRCAVTAIDVDPAAVDVTTENAARNGVSELVHASATPITELRGSFDVVVANILAVTLRDLAGDIARLVANDGHVILSGMLHEQLARVDAACVAVGLEPREAFACGDWRARCYVISAPR